MAKETETLNIYQKLARIRELADAVQKSRKGFNYTYADITDILAKVRAGMKNYGVSLIPHFVPNSMTVEPITTVNTKVDRTGKANDITATEMLFRAEMVWTWVNDENPTERIEIPWIVTGSQADPSQAMGSGLTYTQRQFLTAYFQIPQSDQDVDAIRSKQREAEHAEDRAIAEKLIQEVDSIVKAYVAAHPDERENVKKLITRYEKKSNYFAIHDPELAGRLLEEVRAKLTDENETKAE